MTYLNHSSTFVQSKYIDNNVEFFLSSKGFTIGDNCYINRIGNITIIVESDRIGVDIYDSGEMDYFYFCNYISFYETYNVISNYFNLI